MANKTEGRITVLSRIIANPALEPFGLVSDAFQSVVHDVARDLVALISSIVSVELPMNAKPNSALRILGFRRFKARERPLDVGP